MVLAGRSKKQLDKTFATCMKKKAAATEISTVTIEVRKELSCKYKTLIFILILHIPLQHSSTTIAITQKWVLCFRHHSSINVVVNHRHRRRRRHSLTQCAHNDSIVRWLSHEHAHHFHIVAYQPHLFFPLYRTVVENSVAALGGLDLVIYASSKDAKGKVEEIEDFVKNSKKVMETIFFGAVYTSKYAIPHLAKSQV